MFIIRNMGNFVPPYKNNNDFHGTLAAIEFDVSVLNVKHIIICGHSNCGACRSLYLDLETEKSSIKYQLKNLLTFPEVKKNQRGNTGHSWLIL